MTIRKPIISGPSSVGTVLSSTSPWPHEPWPESRAPEAQGWGRVDAMLLITWCICCALPRRCTHFHYLSFMCIRVVLPRLCNHSYKAMIVSVRLCCLRAHAWFWSAHLWCVVLDVGGSGWIWVGSWTGVIKPWDSETNQSSVEWRDMTCMACMMNILNIFKYMMHMPHSHPQNPPVLP